MWQFRVCLSRQWVDRTLSRFLQKSIRRRTHVAVSATETSYDLPNVLSLVDSTWQRFALPHKL